MAPQSTRPHLLRLLVGDPTRSALRRVVSFTLHVVPRFTNRLGSFVIDTWQYFLHRGMHANTFLFKAFHSWHHRLHVPYSFGALYNHPIEGFALDMCGAGIAEWLTGMSVRQATLLFTIATIKTVDDHSGYSLPFDPLQRFTSNNADYHDIHHQACPLHQTSECILS